MQALVLRAPGQLALENVPIPVPGPGEVLVQVKAATTCGTDLKAWRRGHPQIPMPGPLGHEYSGVVAVVGEGAKFTVGDEVMGVHSAPCGHCFWCLKGQGNLCETIMAAKVLGAYAEYLLVPKLIADVHLFPKPADLPFDQAALLEPLACVAQGILELEKSGAVSQAERVLVIGPGAIGLMFVVALRKLGLEVTLAGRNPDRLAVGSTFGAETVSYADYSPDGIGFDIVIECTGMPEVWVKSVDFSRRGGTVMLFGGCAGGTRVSFDAGRLHYDQISLLSPFHFGTPAVKLAHSWLAEGMDLSALLSGTRRLADAEATFQDLQAGRGLKFVFRPEER